MTNNKKDNGGKNTMTYSSDHRCNDDRDRRYINRVIALASSGAIIGGVCGLLGSAIGAGIGATTGLLAKGKFEKFIFGEELDDTCL